MSIVTQAQKQQFAEDGYFILESVIPEHHLELLCGECQAFIDEVGTQMDEAGTGRYCAQPSKKPLLSLQLLPRAASSARVPLQRADGPDLPGHARRLRLPVLGAVRGEGCRGGKRVLLAPGDSDYIGFPNHKAYLTCWCALDDVSEENGTVHVLPFSSSSIHTWVKYIRDPESNDMIGYFGNDPGVAVEASAGSIAVFTSFNFHSSGINTTDQMRRAYVAQYSSGPLPSADGSKLWGSTEPFLLGGESAVGQVSLEPPFAVA